MDRLRKTVYSHQIGFNRAVTLFMTCGAGYLGLRFIEAASPAISAPGIETSAMGFVAGAIMGFLVFATALEL